MVDVTEIGIHIALLGRAEYITGMREASKVLDDFAGGSRAAGGAAKGMGVSTEEAKRAVSNLRQASVDAVAAQRAYEKALQDSAVAAKEAAASDDRAAASRAER